MKVSVIIPAYNEETRIADSLHAVLAQDYIDVEVIVIDNASTDNTAKVVAQFPVILIRENKKGTMWACEAGRKKATGDIIVRMDADCLPEKNWISLGIKHFSDQRVSASTGPYDYYDGPRVFRTISLAIQKSLYRPASWLIQLTHTGAILIGGNSFMRASSLQRVNGFNTNLTFYGDDTDTAKRLATVGRVIFDPHLVIKTSARRFKAQGSFNLLMKYWYNFAKVIVIPNK